MIIAILFFFIFLLLHLFHSSISQKLQGVSKWSIQWMTAQLSEIFLFLVRAASELRSVCYGSKYASWSLSYMYMQFLHNYTYNSNTNCCIRMFHLLNDSSSIRHIWCQVKSYIHDITTRLQIPTFITTAFWNHILCRFTLITWKLQVVYRHSTYQLYCLRSISPGMKMDSKDD